MIGSQPFYVSNGGGDEQYTPASTVELLLPWIQHLKDKIIWCPFDKEDSQFVQVLKNHGFSVVFSHIDYGQDFFEYEPEAWDVIISNPPYKNKRAFWERSLSLGKPFALLLPINILSDSVINVTMRERERVSASTPAQENKILQRQNRSSRCFANLQGRVFWCQYIQTTIYYGGREA